MYPGLSKDVVRDQYIESCRGTDIPSDFRTSKKVGFCSVCLEHYTIGCFVVYKCGHMACANCNKEVKGKREVFRCHMCRTNVSASQYLNDERTAKECFDKFQSDMRNESQIAQDQSSSRILDLDSTLQLEEGKNNKSVMINTLPVPPLQSDI